MYTSPRNRPVYVTGIKIQKDGTDVTEATVEAGKSITLTAFLEPATATTKTVTWISSATGKATVVGGVVTGVEATDVGTPVTITATADGAEEGQTVSATVSLTVTAVVPVEGIVIDGDSNITIPAGWYKNLTAKVSPVGASEKGCTWSVSGNDKVTVNKDGRVTVAHDAIGAATITATTVGKNASDAVETAIVTVAIDSIAPTVAESYEEYFAPRIAGQEYGSDWVIFGQGDDYKTTTTVIFGSGVKLVTGTGADMKITKKTADSNIARSDGPENSDWKGNTKLVNTMQLAKSGNNGYLEVPVKGDCTISVYWDNNKAPTAESQIRSLLATATATGAKVSVDGGTAETTAFHSVTINPTATKAVGETVVFTYTGGEGTVKLKCNKTSSAGAGGAAYIYGLKVDKATTPPATVSSVTVSATDSATTVAAAGTLQMNAAVTMSDSSSYSGTTTWVATDASGNAIAGVSIGSNGLLSVEVSVAAGTAISVKATAGGVTSTAVVITVTDPNP